MVELSSIYVLSVRLCQAALFRLAVALPLAEALPLAAAFIGGLPLAVSRALNAALPFALSFGFLGLPSLPRPIPLHSAT